MKDSPTNVENNAEEFLCYSILHERYYMEDSPVNVEYTAEDSPTL